MTNKIKLDFQDAYNFFKNKETPLLRRLKIKVIFFETHKKIFDLLKNG